MIYTEDRFRIKPNYPTYPPYHIGDYLEDYFYNKFPRTQKALDSAKTLANKHGAKFCLLGRLIPSVRTFISLVSGVFKIRFLDYIIFS